MVIKIYRIKMAFALVSVLWLLALLTIVVTVLLSVVANDHISGSSYADQVRAQETALAGVNTLISDLRLEMRAGSNVSTNQNEEVWIPRTAESMRIKAVAPIAAAVNYVRSSTVFDPASVFSSSASYDPSNLPPSRASSDASTLTPSRNGRWVPLSLWDKVAMAPANSMDANVPEWIFVQRSGVFSSKSAASSSLVWNSILKDSSKNNDAYVIGRYAYRLYDIGGLLDINAGGAPTTLTAAERRTLEGTLAGIDLTALSNSFNDTNIAALLAFRNPADLSNYANRFSNVLTATNGYMTTSSGNNRFLSRGDLIRFAKKEGFTDALPLLTHFSRDLNSPCWGPTYDASDLGGSAAYAYRSNASLISSTNRLLPTVVSAGESQIDYAISGISGTNNISQGKPRVCRRFPLARISWLEKIQAGSSSLSPAVLACFGLNWDSVNAKWIYNPAGGLTPASTILTLDAVPIGRPPNFFELLKAGILAGSLGCATPTGNSFLNTFDYGTGVSPVAGAVRLQDPNVDYHIIKIGACIIDQYTSTSTPTAIDFDYAPSMPASWKQYYRVPAAGIKNLPYLYTLSQFATLSKTGPDTLTHKAWLELGIWNPHQQIPGTSVVAPALQLSSGAAPITADSGNIQGSYCLSPGNHYTHFVSPGLQATGRTIPFDTAKLSGYLNPQILKTADSLATGSETGIGDIAGRRAFYLGSVNFSDATPPPSSLNVYLSTFGGKNGVPLQLQTKTGAAWSSYQTVSLRAWSGDAWGSGVITLPMAQGASYSYESSGFGGGDPRTTRGQWAQIKPNPAAPPYQYGDNIYNAIPAVSADSDGIVRANDVGSVSPFSANGASERPIILGRQFNTPGDIGYAFRDQQWKSLDFRSANSADAGLLDIFSAYDAPLITAGHINLNSARPEVLKAIIQGTTRNEATGTTYSLADATTVAAALYNMTAVTPMQSRGELVKLPSQASLQSLATNNRKFEKEGALRALSEVGQTRTINLLFDIVAQSGSFPPSAANLNDFQVKGQSHYWVHIAIDRYSGDIVDMQLEPVYE